ncbi:hypothetical protein [Paenibacillus sp. FJAT-27812]|uniref:hypothetical protein n=1 Tax=Paenibacillus sp. FJAT-27812 TaxID=1684143 RepID=UPI0018D0F1BD|nr:hypothetical protein [Paenibacillus sp. FJAT-27812]
MDNIAVVFGLDKERYQPVMIISVGKAIGEVVLKQRSLELGWDMDLRRDSGRTTLVVWQTK